MATTVTGTKTEVDRKLGRSGSGFPGSNGKNGNGWKKHGGDNDGRRHFSPEKYRITMWILLAAIIMMFVALSSAYIVLSGNDQWRPIRMPRMFFLSTGIILVSSLTMRTTVSSLKGGDAGRYRTWLIVTSLLGLGFVASQLLGWRELAGQGVYLSSNPHSSFFFLFTGVHGVHLIGGMLALLYLLARTLGRQTEVTETKRKTLAEVTSLYWHVMDGLWIWLFLLLLVWG
jgi:cytochrome c oxidase subunit III